MQLLGDFASESTEARSAVAKDIAPAEESFDFNYRHQPKRYIGSISDLVKKLPEGLQLKRVSRRQT